jgi:hypothetical protein
MSQRRDACDCGGGGDDGDGGVLLPGPCDFVAENRINRRRCAIQDSIGFAVDRRRRASDRVQTLTGITCKRGDALWRSKTAPNCLVTGEATTLAGSATL